VDNFASYGKGMAQAPEAGWSGPRPFIGRTSVQTELHAELKEASVGAGRFVLLHGPDGSGRAALVRRFRNDAVRRDRHLGAAIGDAADPETPAWRQIALRLTAGSRLGGVARRVLSQWVDPLVPVVGPVIGAIMETVKILRPEKRQKIEIMGTGSTVDQVRTLLVHGGAKRRLIILENLEASDADELAGASSLIQRLPDTQTLFIGTAISRSGALPRPVADLLREAERLKVGRALEIPRLEPAEAVEAVERATRTELPDAWRRWLVRAAPATPTHLWTLLGQIEAEGHLVRHGRRKWKWTSARPESAARVVPLEDSELADLTPDDISLLEAAGRLGPVFDTPDLAAALELDEITLEDRLSRVVRRQRLRLEATTEREDGDLVDRYAFVRPADAARWAARVVAPVGSAGSGAIDAGSTTV
jgi:hypothetical protein